MAYVGMMRRVCAGLALCLSLGGAAQAGVTDPASLDAMVQQAGYRNERKSDSVWALDFSGKTLTTFKVAVALSDDKSLVIVFVIVADHSTFTPDAAFLKMLARENFDIDEVKTGLDDDGDLFVRIDAPARILDAQEFKHDVDQVAAAADEVASKIATGAGSAK